MLNRLLDIDSKHIMPKVKQFNVHACISNYTDEKCKTFKWFHNSVTSVWWSKYYVCAYKNSVLSLIKAEFHIFKLL